MPYHCDPQIKEALAIARIATVALKIGDWKSPQAQSNLGLATMTAKAL
jgi:hypothetical protein